MELYLTGQTHNEESSQENLDPHYWLGKCHNGGSRT